MQTPSDSSRISSTPITPLAPILGSAAMQANWKFMAGMARSTWLRCSDAELIEADGIPSKLTALVQRSYSLSHTEADAQVRRFFEKNKP